MFRRTSPTESGPSSDAYWVERFRTSEQGDLDPIQQSFGKVGLGLGPLTPDCDTFDQGEPCVAVAIRPTYGASTVAVSRHLLDLLIEPPALVLTDEWRILAVLANEHFRIQPQRRGTFFRRLHRGLQAAHGRLALGWSCLHSGSTGWRRAVDEANQALSLVIQVLGPSHAAAYAEVTILSLVSGPHDSGHLRMLQEQLLRPLSVHDQEEHMDLIATLETYLESACNASHTAELLRVHRNSVANRLQRIKELCDVDLEDPDARLLLQLILRSARGCNDHP